MIDFGFQMTTITPQNTSRLDFNYKIQKLPSINQSQFFIISKTLKGLSGVLSKMVNSKPNTQNRIL